MTTAVIVNALCAAIIHDRRNVPVKKPFSAWLVISVASISLRQIGSWMASTLGTLLLGRLI
jgi:hypothetical protein